MGLFIRKQFLLNFNEIRTDSWQVLEEGRIGRLILDGPKGALHIYICYLQSGGTKDNRDARLRSIEILSHHLEDRSKALSICIGDWNFVELDCDRYCLQECKYTGHKDSCEAKVFQETLCKPNAMHDWEQPTMTHRCSSSRSRLDRVYSNHSIVDQLDRNFSIYAMPGCSNSAHRPLAFSRRTPANDGNKSKAIPTWVYKSPEFPAMVAMEFQELCIQDSLRDTTARRLILMKRAILHAAQALQLEHRSQSLDDDDQVGWCMRFIRAAESVQLGRMKACAQTAPIISQYVNPLDPEARSKGGFIKLKDFVVELSRRQVTQDMEQVKKAEDEYTGNKLKNHILVKLKRLLPGAATTIGAVMNEDGQVVDSPKDMAKALQEHWQRTFQAPLPNPDALRTWFEALPLHWNESEDENLPCHHDFSSTTETQEAQSTPCWPTALAGHSTGRKEGHQVLEQLGPWT